MVALNTTAFTNEEIRQLGFEALVEKLGTAGALRFLASFRRGRGDYLTIQDVIFGDMSVEEIHADAAEFWRAHPEFWKDREVI